MNVMKCMHAAIAFLLCFFHTLPRVRTCISHSLTWLPTAGILENFSKTLPSLSVKAPSEFFFRFKTTFWGLEINFPLKVVIKLKNSLLK